MPLWVQAGLWGGFAASALVLGAGLALLVRLPQRLTADIMAFGCGVLISAVAYDLLLDGFERGGIWPIAGGALVGSVAYTLANALIARRGGGGRKRSVSKDGAQADSGLAIAVGSLLDGIPESIVLGAGLAVGGQVSLPMLAAILLSNFPEGLSSAVGMRKAGRSAGYILGLWGGIAVLSGLAAALGAAALADAAPATAATVNAIAAGALLTMIADTMIPEAVAGERTGTGLLVTLGLLTAFALTQLGG